MSLLEASCGARVAGLVAVGVMTLSALGGAACSSSSTSGETPLLTSPDASPSGGDTHDAGSGEGGLLGEGGVVPFDAGADQPAIETLCAAAMQLGKAAQEIVDIGAGSTQPTGGTLESGTYELGSLYDYVTTVADAGSAEAGSGDDGGTGDDDDDDGDGSEFAGDVVESKTLVLGSDGLFSLASATGSLGASDAGLGPTAITAGVYVVSGDTVTLHGTCPSMTESAYTFYASGGLLVLYDGNGLAETFQQTSP